MPRNATLHFNLARAYMSLADQPDKAREQLEAALRIDPHHTPAKLAWAELAMARGEPAQAALATSEVSERRSNQPTALLIRARALVNMAEPEKARSDLAKLLRMYPASADGRDQLAELDFSQQRFQDAEDGFRALLQINDSRGFLGLLKAYIAQGQFQSALAIGQRSNEALARARVIFAWYSRKRWLRPAATPRPRQNFSG